MKILATFVILICALSLNGGNVVNSSKDTATTHTGESKVKDTKAASAAAVTTPSGATVTPADVPPLTTNETAVPPANIIDPSNSTITQQPVVTSTPNPTTSTPKPTTITTTTAPNITTVKPTPAPSSITPSVPPTTPTPNPTTVTPKPTSPITTTTAPNSTTVKPTPAPSSTTPSVPPTTPAPNRNRFDGPSFIGGIVLSLGLVAIGFIGWKYYKTKNERNYHTL